MNFAAEKSVFADFNYAVLNFENSRFQNSISICTDSATADFEFVNSTCAVKFSVSTDLNSA